MAGSADIAAGLCAYLDASPSPFHAVQTAAQLLSEAGFTEVSETDPTPAGPGNYVVRRGGSLIAWSQPTSAIPTAYRIVGAHTDSPNLRIKPQPDLVSAGWQLLGVEVYGGALTNSWLDRDLGLSGRVAVRDPQARGGIGHRLFRCDEPLLRVSQLAIHLDRKVRAEGVKLNDQQHLAPHWGLGGEPKDFRAWLAGQAAVAPEDLLAFEAMAHDLTPARRIGADRELIASARLDNLATSYAAVRALLQACAELGDTAPGGAGRAIPLIVLFDHEEVGSISERGAQSTFLAAWLERIILAAGGTRDDLWRALAGTFNASGDMAHATHPNYSERAEPQHQIAMNGGPVLKINNNLRYATDSIGAAAFTLACEQAGVPMQTFVTRSDLRSGSTVGPITSALTGATTVDFGAPVLSMHSTREICGTTDQTWYAAALAAFLAPRT